jgi:hypothetical protein
VLIVLVWAGNAYSVNSGLDPRATPDHDGRLVDDIVREWAQRHQQPYTLELTDPAGGIWGTGGERITMDALKLCRVVSGPGRGHRPADHAVLI